MGGLAKKNPKKPEVKKKSIFPPINIVKGGAAVDSHTIEEVRNIVALEEDEMNWDIEEDEDIIRLERRLVFFVLLLAVAALKTNPLFRIINVEQTLLDLTNAFDMF